MLILAARRIIHGRHKRLDAGDFREEPGAGTPPARICEGGAEWPSYSSTARVGMPCCNQSEYAGSIQQESARSDIRVKKGQLARGCV
jgi:hypothetical protein